MRDKYVDQVEVRYGKIKEAEVVHHILPRDKFPEYAWDEWNLISVSRTTHESLHDRNTDELTAKGVALVRRTCKRIGMEMPKVYKEQIKEKNKSLARKGKYF